MGNRATTPSGWSSSAIGSVCTFSRGVSWKKSQERRSPTAGAVPVLRIPNVRETLKLTDLLYIDGLTKAQQAKARVKRGWTLLVGSNGNPKRVGNCVYVAKPRDFLFASFLIGATPTDSRRVNSEFLYRLLSSSPVQHDIWQSVQGSTGLSNIDLNSLKSLHVQIPPFPEQRKIAAILSSVDDAIEKTQAVIDQVQVVKRGLMQELLTRGLPGQHTKFKQTEIGEVPESWQVSPLGQFIENGPDNGLYRPQKEYGKGTPILRIDTFENGDRLRQPQLKRVLLDAGEAEKFAVKTGDILINRVNSLSHLGKCALVVSFNETTVFESNMMRLSLDDARVTAEFGFLWLSSEQVRAHLGSKAKRAVAQASINQTDVVTIPTPCPPRSEQQQIAEIIGRIERRLEAEAEGLAGLREMKSALMSVLLTGELRVTPDTEAA